MVPHLIEQHAQAKHLGMFEKCYSESPSEASFIFLFIFIAFVSIIILCPIIGGIVALIGNLMSSLTILPFPGIASFFVFLLLIGGGILSIAIWMLARWMLAAGRRGYQENRGKWLYLYTNGFVYETPAQTQAYHVDEILSVEMHQHAHGSGDSVSISTSYRVNLDANRGFIDITHGAEVKYRFELYQRQLLNQLRKRQQGGPGNTP